MIFETHPVTGTHARVGVMTPTEVRENVAESWSRTGGLPPQKAGRPGIVQLGANALLFSTSVTEGLVDESGDGGRG